MRYFSSSARRGGERVLCVRLVPAAGLLVPPACDAAYATRRIEPRIRGASRPATPAQPQLHAGGSFLAEGC